MDWLKYGVVYNNNEMLHARILNSCRDAMAAFYRNPTTGTVTQKATAIDLLSSHNTSGDARSVARDLIAYLDYFDLEDLLRTADDGKFAVAKESFTLHNIKEIRAMCTKLLLAATDPALKQSLFDFISFLDDIS